MRHASSTARTVTARRIAVRAHGLSRGAFSAAWEGVCVSARLDPLRWSAPRAARLWDERDRQDHLHRRTNLSPEWHGASAHAWGRTARNRSTLSSGPLDGAGSRWQKAHMLIPLLTAAALSPAVQAFVKLDKPVIAITRVRVIDGTGAAPRENQTVVISGGKIAAVGPSG